MLEKRAEALYEILLDLDLGLIHFETTRHTKRRRSTMSGKGRRGCVWS
jgi:hypothetical protein